MYVHVCMTYMYMYIHTSLHTCMMIVGYLIVLSVRMRVTIHVVYFTPVINKPTLQFMIALLIIFTNEPQ